MRHLLSLLVIFYVLTYSGIQAQEPPYNNPSITEVNVAPARANFIPFKNAQNALQVTHKSDRNLLLNGEWGFQMVEGKKNIPSNFYEENFDDSHWGILPVPSNWQRHGHGFPVYSNKTLDMEPDEVGLYRYKFNLPEDWGKGRTFIHFAGVKTAFHLYVNGVAVGYSEGAYLPSEFDLSDFLRKGENLLSVAVYRVVDIQKIENFDTWRLSGIFRDVSLMYRPKTFIEDVEIQAKAINNYKDGKWEASISIRNKSNKKASNLDLLMQVRTLIGKRLIFEKKIPIPTILAGQRRSVSYSQEIEDVMLWSAEQPNLYTTVLELQKKGSSLEATSIQTGFRTIEVIDEQIKINGKKVYFKGVNRHDWHPTMARAIDKNVIRKDLEFMKRYNINSLRTAHYPNDSYLYQMADSLGIYVMDEAAMETHWKTHAESEDGWRNAHLSRMIRMVERDKNHASVILWSLGNEFFMGPHTHAMYEWVVKRDPFRLIYSDGNPKREGMLIQPTAYNNANNAIGSSLKYRKPLLMKEYMHAAGNEMGLFGYLWDLIRNPTYKNLHGGFIWDFKDQGWNLKDENQQNYYDWGEDVGVSPTGNDGFDGITNSDLEETPKILEVAKVYQDIKVTAVNAKNGVFKIENRHSFLSLTPYKAHWTMSVNGTPMETQQLKQLTTKAGDTEQIKINLNQFLTTLNVENDVQILFEFRTKEQRPGIPKDHVIAWDQLEIQAGTTQIVFNNSEKENKVSLYKGDHTLLIQAGVATYRFHKELGRLISWKIEDTELLDRTQGPKLNLWRATIDADNSGWGGLQKKYYWPWKRLGIDDAEFLDYMVKDVNIVEESTEKVVFDVSMELVVANAPITKVDFRYTIMADGSLIMGVNFLPGDEMKKLDGLPRLGLTTHFKKEFEHIKWYGNGPHENYRDRSESAKIGEYQNTVPQLYTSYIPAQANGNRSHIQWVSIGNNEKRLKITRLSKENTNGNNNQFLPGYKSLSQQSNPLFEFTAIPYTEHELDITTHTKDLPFSDRVILTIDSEHAGVASHPRPGRLKQHEVKPVDKSFIFLFSPEIVNK